MRYVWKQDWPTEAGYYWFYGTRTPKPDEMRRLEFVQVRHTADGNPVYIAGGSFLYRSEGVRGWWLEQERPDTSVLDRGGNAGPR